MDFGPEALEPGNILDNRSLYGELAGGWRGITSRIPLLVDVDDHSKFDVIKISISPS